MQALEKLTIPPANGNESHKAAIPFANKNEALLIAIPLPNKSTGNDDDEDDNRPFFPLQSAGVDQNVGQQGALCNGNVARLDSTTSTSTLEDSTEGGSIFCRARLGNDTEGPNCERSGGHRGLDLDSDGRIAPYVDFSEFHQVFMEMGEEEREELERELKPRDGYQTIYEEGGTPMA